MRNYKFLWFSFLMYSSSRIIFCTILYKNVLLHFFFSFLYISYKIMSFNINVNKKNTDTLLEILYFSNKIKITLLNCSMLVVITIHLPVNYIHLNQHSNLKRRVFNFQRFKKSNFILFKQNTKLLKVVKKYQKHIKILQWVKTFKSMYIRKKQKRIWIKYWKSKIDGSNVR